MRQCIAQARRRRNNSGSSASNPPLIAIMNIDTSVTSDDFIHFVKAFQLPLPYRLQYGFQDETSGILALARFGTLEETALFTRNVSAFPLRGRLLMTAHAAWRQTQIKINFRKLVIFNVADAVKQEHLLELMDALYVPRPYSIHCSSETEGLSRILNVCIQGGVALAFFHFAEYAVKARDRLNHFVLRGQRLCVEFLEEDA
ncbi:hypothetical protein HDK77DRAFT_40064 [Phyllosticta capitalensis]|uniref:RRM domain-containing protein n=1 Tax=Phyllosticta capitalensis TaxID=121624 RepID=A0ABR1Z294_9PEZI